MISVLSKAHDRRLRAVYRSAGWPYLDAIEVDLVAAGYLERIRPATGPEYLRVTDAGIVQLSAHLQRNRAALDLHEALVHRVADHETREGRIAYRGLTLLAKPGEDWLHLRPDVFSIRNTTVEDYVDPVVFEIKVKRADLKGDLKRPEKRAGYLAFSSECYYVLAAGVGTADDVPPECGVIIETAQGLDKVRRAPKKAMRLGFTQWMTLAKASCHCGQELAAAQL